MYHEIADIAADEFEVIAISKHVSTYGIKKTKLGQRAPKQSRHVPVSSLADAALDLVLGRINMLPLGVRGAPPRTFP